MVPPALKRDLEELHFQMAGLREELRGLRDEHRLLISNNEELTRRLEQRAVEVRGLRTKLRRASAGPSQRRSAGQGQFTDPGEQFRHEVHLA